MNSDSFWSMGGYGFYVWGAYGVAVVLFASEVLQLRRRKRVLHEQLRGAPEIEER